MHVVEELHQVRGILVLAGAGRSGSTEQRVFLAGRYRHDSSHAMSPCTVAGICVPGACSLVAGPAGAWGIGGAGKRQRLHTSASNVAESNMVSY
jgi:hypothetical protein